MRLIAALAALFTVVAALAGCGSASKEADAKNTVCDSRADIAKHVNTLKSLTPSTATTSQVKDSLTAIRDDLEKITDAQGDLSDARKSEVQAANDAFSTKVQDIASQAVANVSLADAKIQLGAALQELASAYQESFAKVDCSS